VRYSSNPISKNGETLQKNDKIQAKKNRKKRTDFAFWTNLAHHKIESTGIVATKTHPS
jgi:hypothetical protein